MCPKINNYMSANKKNIDFLEDNPTPLNNQNTTLKELIFKKDKIIPKELCNLILSEINSTQWESHSWYGKVDRKSYYKGSEEPDVQYIEEDLWTLISPYIFHTLKEYESNFLYSSELNITKRYSNIRINRYSVGQKMNNHFDHIHSLFSPPEQGIPILSMVVNFNEDYDGGELVFWNDYSIKMKTGDIIIFPSLFLYPHRVNEVIRNVRYSGVLWFW